MLLGYNKEVKAECEYSSVGGCLVSKDERINGLQVPVEMVVNEGIVNNTKYIVYGKYNPVAEKFFLKKIEIASAIEPREDCCFSDDCDHVHNCGILDTCEYYQPTPTPADRGEVP